MKLESKIIKPLFESLTSSLKELFTQEEIKQLVKEAVKEALVIYLKKGIEEINE